MCVHPASSPQRVFKGFGNRTLLYRCDMRIQRQRKDAACRRLSDRKISWTISVIAESGLQVYWYRVVDSCLYAPFMKYLKDTIPARYLHDV